MATAQRTRKLSRRKLAAEVQKGEQGLDQLWRDLRRKLTLIESLDRSESKATSAEAQNILETYACKWYELRDLYAENDDYLEDAEVTKTAVDKNCKFAKEVLSDQRLETMSLHSVGSRRSSRSNLSNSSSVLRAQAAAAAAAASENVAFEELIAQRISESKTKKAISDLERVKQEAEAEAELRILRARQSAAVEKAKSDAILECDRDQRTDNITSPDQSSNDHAERYVSSFNVGNRPPPTSEMRASAPPFSPTKRQPELSPNNPFNTPTPYTLPSPPKFTSEDRLIDLTMQVTNTLAQQRQPIHEPEIFGGDPLLFRPWKSSFEAMLARAQNSASEKLSYLSKYTQGEVKQLVDRYRHRHLSSPDNAYQEVWLELERRFGNTSMVTSEIIHRITSFSKLKREDRKQLQALSDLCVDAASQMGDLPGLNILNYPQTMFPIIEKLPDHIHNDWRKEVSRYKLSYGTYPNFAQFTYFLRQKAQMYNDPDLYPAEEIPQVKQVKSAKPQFRVLSSNMSPPATSNFCFFHKQEGHNTADCIALGRRPIEDRREFCRKLGLCYKCGQKHLAKDCSTELKCKKCQSSQHASFMHTRPSTQADTRNRTDVPVPQATTEEGVQANINCTKFTSCSFARSCSKIILAKMYHQKDPSSWIYGYVVLDDQSNACLGDPQLFDKLRIKSPEHEYELSTCGGHHVQVKGRRASGIVIESLSGHKEQLPTVIENQYIPGDRDEIPCPDVCQSFRHLRDIGKFIPEPMDDVRILLLLGRNCPEPLKVRESRNGPRGTPWAQRTDLGWTVSGQICVSSVRGIQVSTNRTVLRSCDDHPTCKNHIFAKDLLSKQQPDSVFIEHSDDEQKSMSVEDKRFVQMMSEGAHTNYLGNLEFPLPFRIKDQRLPNNRSQAKSRLNSLLKTLQRKPDMMMEYRAFMEKIISRGHASPIPADEYMTAHGKVWYLPHFAVRHPKKSSIRVVFDASAEFDGISLNKTLLQGPDQMNSLLGILMRFRTGQTAVMGDIEQMFHNFYVDPKDRNYLRFLWFQNNDPSKPIVDHQMNVHLFGSISSPAVATYGLRMVANACKTTHGEDVADFVNRDFYVDDGLTSQPDAISALSLIQRTCDALRTKNLRFHKIVSNDIEVIKALPEQDRADNLQSVDFQREELPTQRSLGVQWNLEKDAFTFKVSLPDKPFSRRGVLSIASSIFDPLGLVAPVSIEGKMLLRELITEMKGEEKLPNDVWDRPLPEVCRPKWNRWQDSLYRLEHLQIPRCFVPADFGTVSRREVHVFSDASERAIGAVAYLRQINSEDAPHVSFLLAKAKVTPKHAVSIPRLELCAAVLATSLVRTITPELAGCMTIDDTVYYTDSRVVLGYIRNESKRFHVYVANRVHNIHSVSSPNQWHYIQTDHNPADLASRSVPAHQLSSTPWFRGPDFLWEPQLSHLSCIQTCTEEMPLNEEDPEVRRQIFTLATTTDESSRTGSTHLDCKRFLKFSTWSSLKRAIANLIVKVKTFKSKSSAPDNKMSKELPRQPTVHELQDAEKVIVRAIQQDYFGEDIKFLQYPETDPKQKRIFRKTNTFRKLNPFSDEDNIIRVGGRLRRADIDLAGRHPILLPKGCHVSRLVAEHFHKAVHHQGRQISFSAVRSGGYWIAGLHGLVRSIINACVSCKKLRGKQLTQKMADLPKDRLEITPPFTAVGIDVFGPWLVKFRKTRGGSADAKRWAVIFTCMCSRAVHCEIIESMDSSAFIMALRRFIAIRGPVARIRSDQGTNFVGAVGDLNASVSNLNQKQISEFLSSQDCEWTFNPPHASHFGGVWERQIGTMRRVLESMFCQMGKRQLTHEVLVTFMAEACAIVNSRPIATISSDVNDPAPLNPNMLLTQKTRPLQLPPGGFVPEDLYSRKRWRHAQYLADQFWTRWRKEYLLSLQPRQKWLTTKPNVTEGDVVLLKQKDAVRYTWPLARVVKTYESEDGKVRKVDVTTCSDGVRRTFSRPISELILLEKARAKP